jgi:hypothetical protein
MALEFIGFLYTGPSETGRSLAVGVGHKQRYNPIRQDVLDNFGFASNIQSASLFTTPEATANLIFLQNDDFSGAFAQASEALGTGKQTWGVGGQIRSVLLVASDRGGERDYRISFRDQFLQTWDNYLDQKLAGEQASRNGDPTLTWQVFPQGIPNLDPNLAYLKIYQPLHISLPWYWSDYEASMTYYLYPYIDGNGRLRTYGARWEYWVEKGAKSHKIGDRLRPKVENGLPELVDVVNRRLASFDRLGSLRDVYLLPGNQLFPIGTGGVMGFTTDDVTIVVTR